MVSENVSFLYIRVVHVALARKCSESIKHYEIEKQFNLVISFVTGQFVFKGSLRHGFGACVSLIWS